MGIEFYKYHGAGNDFIIIEDLNNDFISSLNNTQKFISKICHRHFGVGADGLMLLQKSPTSDFKMLYFNSDGKEGSMCGNGGRCIAALAYTKAYASKNMSFEAVDGKHKASIEKAGMVNLKMLNVFGYKKHNDAYIINTGSPHYVKFVNNLDKFDVYSVGKAIRYDSKYKPDGINVNFVEIINNELFVRTFERGVENETLSCGTGVVASAIAARLKGFSAESDSYRIVTKGGVLNVKFTLNNNENEFVDVWLKGPAVKVFKGTYNS